MNKSLLVEKIVAALQQELEGYLRSARAAHAEATDEQSKAENKYDTRGLEASYLAHGQSRQAAEVVQGIAEFEAFEVRAFGKGEAIDMGALVELERGSERHLYFIGPRSGGTEILVDQKSVLVITPSSPLCKQLMGRTEGEKLKLEARGEITKAVVVSVT